MDGGGARYRASANQGRQDRTGKAVGAGRVAPTRPVTFGCRAAAHRRRPRPRNPDTACGAPVALSDSHPIGRPARRFAGDGPPARRAADACGIRVPATTHRSTNARSRIPAERPLTVFVDKRELVTLMTLGAAPEAAGAGLPANQRLVEAWTRSIGDGRLGRGGRCVVRLPRRHQRFEGAATRQPRGHHRLRPGHGVRRLMADLDEIRLPPPSDPGPHQPGPRSTACSTPCGARRAPASRPARCTAARCSARTRC